MSLADRGMMRKHFSARIVSTVSGSHRKVWLVAIAKVPFSFERAISANGEENRMKRCNHLRNRLRHLHQNLSFRVY